MRRIGGVLHYARLLSTAAPSERVIAAPISELRGEGCLSVGNQGKPSWVVKGRGPRVTKRDFRGRQ